MQDLVNPSIQEEENGMSEKPLDQSLVALSTQETLPTTPSEDWRVPFIRYLTDDNGCLDKMENECLLRRRKHYLLVDG